MWVVESLRMRLGRWQAMSAPRMRESGWELRAASAGRGMGGIAGRCVFKEPEGCRKEEDWFGSCTGNEEDTLSSSGLKGASS